MDCRHCISLLQAPRVLVAVAATSAIFLAGCSSLVTTATSSNPLSSGGTVTGKVHGGNQAVSGATVRVRFAGQVGIGRANPSPYDVIATTTSSTDGTGSFSFVKDPVNGASHPSSGNTFACPAQTVGDPFVYVEAVGGNTLNDGKPGENNTAAVFLAPLGLCTAISSATFVNLSEATTVATMAALSQFFDPTTNAIGSNGSGLGTKSMGNSFGMAAELVDLTKGVILPTFTLAGSSTGASHGVGGVTVTATPEANKLNQMANIISACVNTTSGSSTPCQTLFANAVSTNQAVTSRPPGTRFPVATDVRQALYYMFTNPTNGGTANLQRLYALAPAAGAAYQPALAAAPTDWTVAVSYTTNGTCGTSPAPFISSPSDINIDTFGNVWFANANSGNLSAITSTGIPKSCATAGGDAKAGGVVDNKGNIWTGTSTTGLIRYNPFNFTSVTFTTPGQVLAIAADGNAPVGSNIYFVTAGSLYMIPAGAVATASTSPTQISSVVGSPSRIAVDSSSPQNIWSVSGSSLNQTFAASSGGNLLNGYSTATYTTTGPAYGVAVSSYGPGVVPMNDVYVSSGASANLVTKFAGSGTSYAAAGGWPTAGGFAGLNTPTALALDGVGNAWVTNFQSNATTLLSSVSEISAGKVDLSPVGFQKASSYLGAGRADVVDSSGNVWIVGDGSSTITEILGAAVPVCQPVSTCLSIKRFQQIP